MESDSLFRTPKFRRGLLRTLLFLMFIVSFKTEIIISIKFLWFVLGLIVRQPFAILLNTSIRQAAFTEISNVITYDVIRSLWVLAANAGMYFVLFIGSMFLVAQFALPIQEPKDRWPAFWRLLYYRFKRHGAALFVKEGRRIARQKEDESYLPGVVLVDLNSAIVIKRQKDNRMQPFDNSRNEPAGWKVPLPAFLEKMDSSQPSTDTPVSRAEGPGLVFTEYGETIYGEIDLRKQIRVEPGVQAYTRDGIKVRANVIAVFTLGEAPETLYVTYLGERKAENLRAIQIGERTVSEVPLKKQKFIQDFYPLDPKDAQEIHQAFQRGDLRSDSTITETESKAVDTFNPPYQFDPERVSSAVYASSYDAEEIDIESWTDLPTKVATEMFRNEIALYTYDHLYKLEDEKEYPLMEYKADFARRMRYQGVMSYRLVLGKHRPPEIGMAWDEASLLMLSARELVGYKLLRDYGIKVIHAGYTELVPEDRIRQKRLENWMAGWEKEIEITKAENELRAIRIKNNARAQAQSEMASSLSSLYRSAEASPQAMALRVFQALETAATDPVTSQLLPKDVITMIQNLQRWLIVQRRKKTPPAQTNQKNEQK